MQKQFLQYMSALSNYKGTDLFILGAVRISFAGKEVSTFLVKKI